MSWFKLDDSFFDNPKIIPLSDSAIVCFLKCGTYCASQLTDGFVPERRARDYAGKAKVLSELVPSLLESTAGGFMVHDYLKYNPKREQVLKEKEAKNAVKSKAGSKGAAARWQNDGKGDGKTDGKPIAEGMANAWQNDGPHPHPLPDPQEKRKTPHERRRDPVEQVLVDFGPVGAMNAATPQDIEYDIEEFTLEWVQKAVAKARGSGKSELPWNYCHSTLEDWRRNGFPDDAEPRQRSNPRLDASPGLTAADRAEIERSGALKPAIVHLD